MLKNRQPYRDPGADYFNERYRIRFIRNLHRRACKLGLSLEPIGTS